MHPQVLFCCLGVSFSCCRELRDSLPSVSDRGALTLTRGVGNPSVVASKFGEDFLTSRGSKTDLQKLRLLRSYPLKETRSSTASSDSKTGPNPNRREISPASQPANPFQSILDIWCQANLPNWIAKLSLSPLPQWLLVSIFTSSLYLYTPTADAVGIFTPRVAGNAVSMSGKTALQNATQDSEAFRARVSVAIDLLEKGQKAQANGDFCKALDFYEEVKEKAGDLALAEYARVGHAVTLYEVGDRSEAITEMEDVSVALRGYPEIHAALAAALYVDKHAPLPAEKQFNIATLLDPRYTNVKWVEETKHWPPSLINSLKRFISLQ